MRKALSTIFYGIALLTCTFAIMGGLAMVVEFNISLLVPVLISGIIAAFTYKLGYDLEK